MSEHPPVESPCNGGCIIEPETGYCEGCWRTMREITRWTSFSDAQRREVLEQIELRKAGLVGPAED